MPRGGRIALVGPNGAGKTTFLRILVGLDEPSGGTLSRMKGLRIGYLPQESDWSAQGTLWAEMLTAFEALRAQEAELAHLESLISNPGGAPGSLASPQAVLEKYGRLQEQFELAGGYEYELRIKNVLTGLGFEAGDYDRPLVQLSGGQKTRLVSHDRYLIDALATQVWSLENGRLEVFGGNYSEWVTEKEQGRKQEAAWEDTSQGRQTKPKGANGTGAKGRLQGAGGKGQKRPISNPTGTLRSLQSRISAQRRAAELETIIASLEIRLAELGRELEAAGSSVEKVRTLGEEYARVEADLNAHIAEWEAVVSNQ